MVWICWVLKHLWVRFTILPNSRSQLHYVPHNALSSYISSSTYSPAACSLDLSSFFSLGRPGFILSGLVGPLPPTPAPPVAMKWANSSVCLSKNPNLLLLSDSYKIRERHGSLRTAKSVSLTPFYGGVKAWGQEPNVLQSKNRSVRKQLYHDNNMIEQESQFLST